VPNVLNKAILGINALVLVTTFVVAYGAQSTQVDLLDAAALAGNSGPHRHDADAPAPTTYLRLLQSLEAFAPRETIDAFSAKEMDVVYRAIEHHHHAVASGVRAILGRREDGAGTRAEVERLSKEARDGVHALLSRAFRDGEFVNRLPAAIAGGVR
jgi:hypothetical protein